MSNATKISELKAEIEKLEAEDKRMAEMPEDQRLAIKLHKLLCHHNHIDGCSWTYEGTKAGDDWNGYAHKEYLEKAQVLMVYCKNKGIIPDDIIDAITLLRGY